MQSSTRAGIARIDVMQQGRSISRGTGFLAADGLVLTALHVVADRTKESLTPYPGEIVLTFPDHTTKAVIHENYFDRMADWALLKCETAPPVRPLPLAELRKGGIAWETYGFPDANPRDGLVNVGDVTNHQGILEGNSVFQLYSREAAAGQGEPVKGLSGSPVIVENAVVGVLRFALMNKDQQTVAGTLYACPLASVLKKASSLLPMPDPCFGLPGLPRQDLPPDPFRYLAWFTDKEAEVFFGRNTEIRETYNRLTSDDAPPVTLLYGQSGVGKSSFLDAGVAPRLQWYHEVRYVRRDVNSSLLQTLCTTLQQAGGPNRTLSDWQSIEAKTGKPLIVFFDQIEEIYTRPNAQHSNELEELIKELKTLFAGPQPPRGRLVLSFRKEWFPEMQKQMELQGLSYGKVFLEGLDRENAIEVVQGLTQTERLRQFYGLKIEDGLPEIIANDLAADRDSPIAPTLQILLTKMWRSAKKKSPSAPAITIDLYQKLKKEGLLLGDFLDQQLEALKKLNASWVESGLALDVLAFHTTSLLTAAERKRGELDKNYNHPKDDMTRLLEEMGALFLLTDAAAENPEDKTTRLSHDTLAPLVRRRFEQSEKPGQHARRILESRATDWTEGSPEGVLDDHSLQVVLRGQAGMRVLSDHERKLVDASSQQRDVRQRNRKLRRALALAAVLLIVAGAGIAAWQSRQALHEKEIAELRYSTAKISQLLPNDPAYGLLVAIHAVGWSQHVQGFVSSAVVKNLAWAVEEARERLLFPPAQSAAISTDGVIALAGSTLQFWSATTGKQIEQLTESETQVHCGSPRCVLFSPDQKLVALAGNGILIWTREARRGRVIFPGDDTFIAAAFSPGSDRVAGITRTGAVRISTVTGGEIGNYRIEAFLGKVSFAAVTFVTNTEGFIAIAGTDQKVYLSDLTGKQISPPFEGHRHPVTSIALNAAADLVIASGDDGGNLILWNQQGELLTDPRHLHDTPISALGFDPQGDMVATAGSDSVMNFLSLDGRAAEVSVHGFNARVDSLTFSPDGTRLLTTSGSHTRLIDTYGIRIRAPFNTRKMAPGNDKADRPKLLSAVTLGSRQTVAAADVGGDVILWHPPSGYLRRIAATSGSRLVGMVFSEDEGILVTGSLDGELRVWDRTGNAVGAPWRIGDPETFAFDLEPKGKFLVTADGQRITLWETATQKDLHSIAAPETEQISSVKFMSSGTDFVTSTGQVLRFWTIRSGKIEEAKSPEIRLPDGWTAFGWSSNGKTFVAGNEIGEIRLYRADGAGIAEPFNPHDAENPVHGAVGFADGETAASFIRDGQKVTFCRFGIERCVPVEVAGHLGSITGIALSPDGETLVSVGRDATIRLLRAHWTTWLEISCDRLKGHPVFQNPVPPVDVDVSAKAVREARETCRTMVWEKK